MKHHLRHPLDLLRAGTGRPEAEFREGQDEAIRHIVEGRGRLLVVQKTGWGKSLVYFIATKLLRESGAGPALLISPLLALMRNQIAAVERMGIHAVRITSDNREHWEDVEARLQRDEVDILLISPERLGNERFRDEVLVEIAESITQQARNVDGSLVVSVEPLPRGPVLLVDDMVDSRWTLTVAAWLLRLHGSGEVWPFALAFTSHGR